MAPWQAEQYRKDAVKFIFKSLDMDGDGFLNGSEMQRFAELCGFDDEWEVEYEVPVSSQRPHVFSLLYLPGAPLSPPCSPKSREGP